MDSLEDDELLSYVLDIWAEPFPTLPSWYRVLTNKNELFMGFRSNDGTYSIRAYAERDAKPRERKPASDFGVTHENVLPVGQQRT